MQWTKPEFEEISLACEISSYANAELPALPELSAPERQQVRPAKE
jgi:coenzyme PQQ precursor peptide PqqA